MKTLHLVIKDIFREIKNYFQDSLHDYCYRYFICPIYTAIYGRLTVMIMLSSLFGKKALSGIISAKRL